MNHSTEEQNSCEELLTDEQMAEMEQKDFLFFIAVYAVVILLLVLFGNFLQPEAATAYMHH